MRLGLLIAIFLAPLMALCFIPRDSAAHDEAKGIIKDRMEVMTSVGRKMKSIGRMVRGTVPLENQKIARKAEKISAHSRSMRDLFPKGSNDGPSRASDEIWQHWDLFLANAAKLTNAAHQLAETARTGDENAIKASYRALSKTCGGCHKLFRNKKKAQEAHADR